MAKNPNNLPIKLMIALDMLILNCMADYRISRFEFHSRENFLLKAEENIQIDFFNYAYSLLSLEAELSLSTTAADVVLEGDIFDVCVSFTASSLQRDVYVGLAIPDSFNSKYKMCKWCAYPPKKNP